MTKSAKSFTYNRLNLNSMNKMHEDIAEFTTGKKVLDYNVENKFMNITVTIVVEEEEKKLIPDGVRDRILRGLTIEIDVPKKTSEYRGVSWRSRDSKWRVEITAHNKRHYLGQYDCEIEAANVYDRKALELLGKKAVLNFENEVIL